MTAKSDQLLLTRLALLFMEGGKNPAFCGNVQSTFHTTLQCIQIESFTSLKEIFLDEQLWPLLGEENSTVHFYRGFSNRYVEQLCFIMVSYVLFVLGGSGGMLICQGWLTVKL